MSHIMTKPVMLFANKGTDQHAHLHSLISTSVVHCLDSIIPIFAGAKISRLLEQASLCHTWSQTRKDRFSCDVTQIIKGSVSPQTVGGLWAYRAIELLLLSSGFQLDHHLLLLHACFPIRTINANFYCPFCTESWMYIAKLTNKHDFNKWEKSHLYHLNRFIHSFMNNAKPSRQKMPTLHKAY